MASALLCGLGFAPDPSWALDRPSPDPQVQGPGETARPAVDRVLSDTEVGARPPPGHTRALAVPRTTLPPRIDGVLDDTAWRTAAVGDRFWVVEQQRAPTDRTEVLVTSDAQYLYVAFRAYDSQPDGIVALDTRADASLKGDDQVVVELDPFLSHREVSSYSVNARGTISDSVAGGRASQRSWKGLWQGAAARTPNGWTAEIAIPFDILNFEPGTTRFGVNFLRYQKRTTEWSRWADTTPLDLPEERGQLVDLGPFEPRAASRLTLMPFVLLGRNVPDRKGEVKDNLASTGIDIRFQRRPNQTAVVSLLPDFSQVEKAINSIDFSYNEKFLADNRPFFKEGSAYFTSKEDSKTQETYFYTQRIPNFDVGAKFFGRSPGLQFGALATQSPGGRTDAVLRVQREFSAAHSVGATVAVTDQSRLSNVLLATDVEWRQASGVYYEGNAAVTRTEHAEGNGAFVEGEVGWRNAQWTVKAIADQYDLDFRPELGLLNADLRDTRALRGSVSYYRDNPRGLLREVTGYLTTEYRETGDGRLQRRANSAGGTAEFREQQIRLGVYYSQGPYRPLKKKTPGAWSDTLNDDWYVSTSIDFNTRNTTLQYGGSFATGLLAGGDYEYKSAYVNYRPTATTSVGLSAQQLDSFGRYRQVVATAGWNINPRNSLYTRYYTSNGDQYFRLAYVYNMRPNIDWFFVYERQPETKDAVSLKLLMSFR